MQQPKTTAVIVTYHSRQMIGRGLAAAHRSHEQGLLECVVVDNASSDGTAEFVRREHSWVKLIAAKENIGFGRGCNLGFEQVRTPYVLMLNPDAVLEPEALRVLLGFMESHQAAGIAGPAMRATGDLLQHAGMMPTPWDVIRAATGTRRAYRHLRPIVPGQPPFQTNWLCGAAMLIRSGLFAELGGFDPRFFLYFEETDLCRRAARHGAGLWAIGEAVGDHPAAGSAHAVNAPMYGNCIAEHFFQSRFYYMMKHYGWFAAVGVEVIELALLAVRQAARRCVGRKDGGRFRERLSGPILSLPAKV